MNEHNVQGADALTNGLVSQRGIGTNFVRLYQQAMMAMKNNRCASRSKGIGHHRMILLQVILFGHVQIIELAGN